ncbi:MAG: glycosyltransferase family 4 protein [Chloroflexi bacterium]|nr:glycosyltransferase family 4 protein [Chloroflexota bacterium]
MGALLLTHGFPPDIGGIQTYLHARCLGVPPYEVQVVAPDRPGAAIFDRQQPFPIWRWPVAPGLARPAQVVGPLIGGMRAERYGQNRVGDVEWLECGQLLPVGLAGYWLGRRLGRPYLVWVYGQELLRPQRLPWNVMGGITWLMRFVLHHARAVMAISQGTVEILRKLGVPRWKIHIIRPGVSPDLLAFQAGPFGGGHLEKVEGPTSQPRDIIQGVGLANRPVVLSVGRLVRRKGHDVLLQAVAQARQACSELACVIVGEGPYRGQLENEIRRLGLAGHAFLAGEVPPEELAQAYASATMFAMMSRYAPELGRFEGFGIVFREAGLFGLPVVGTRAAGIPDAVIDGVTGLLVPPDDVSGAAAALVRLVRDPQLARQLGENGREHACERPDWGRIREVMIGGRL